MIQEVADRTSPPYSAGCFVVSVFPNGATLRGSGVLVGPNDVLTALHLVYEEDYGGWAKNVYVTPGADTSPFDAPFGTFSDVGRIDGRMPDWEVDGDGLVSSFEAQHDLALIGFKSAIGDAAGWIAPISQPQDIAATVAGYPVQTPAGPVTGLMQSPVAAAASSQYGVYDVPFSLGPGTSGGPLLWTADGQTIVTGIASSASLDETRSTFAALYGEGTWDWLSHAAAANDSLVVSLATSIAGTPGDGSLVDNNHTKTKQGNTGNDNLRGMAGDDTLS